MFRACICQFGIILLLKCFERNTAVFGIGALNIIFNLLLSGFFSLNSFLVQRIMVLIILHICNHFVFWYCAIILWARITYSLSQTVIFVFIAFMLQHLQLREELILQIVDFTSVISIHRFFVDLWISENSWVMYRTLPASNNISYFEVGWCNRLFNEKYPFRYLKVSASADSPPGDMCAVYRTDRSWKMSILIIKNFNDTCCSSSSDSGIHWCHQQHITLNYLTSENEEKSTAVALDVHLSICKIKTKYWNKLLFYNSYLTVGLDVPVINHVHCSIFCRNVDFVTRNRSNNASTVHEASTFARSHKWYCWRSTSSWISSSFHSPSVYNVSIIFIFPGQ